MLSFIQRNFRAIDLVLLALLGLSLGHLTATALGVFLSPPTRFQEELGRTAQPPGRKPTLADYQPILQRNIFDSTAQEVQSVSAAPSPQATPSAQAQPSARTDLTLLGTVAAGPDSLALIRAGREVEIYRLEDDVPGGGRLEKIERNQVHIKNPDGTTEILPLYQGDDQGAARTAARPTRKSTRPQSAGAGIRPVGENRWEISQEEVEKARGNLNELLKQARMEPHIVNGQTEGFVVRMIQRNSLLAKLGIRRGDVVMQVNGVELDSPEKALQIFQQLREARNINIGLSRNGERMNFEYEIN